jgi:hypothetical protein
MQAAPAAADRKSLRHIDTVYEYGDRRRGLKLEALQFQAETSEDRLGEGRVAVLPYSTIFPFSSRYTRQYSLS